VPDDPIPPAIGAATVPANKTATTAWPRTPVRPLLTAPRTPVVRPHPPAVDPPPVAVLPARPSGTRHPAHLSCGAKPSRMRVQPTPRAHRHSPGTRPRPSLALGRTHEPGVRVSCQPNQQRHLGRNIAGTKRGPRPAA